MRTVVKLEQFSVNFEKRHNVAGLRATLRPAASASAFESAEARIGRSLPNQVHAFYSQCNGFVVQEPPFEVLPIENLFIDDQSHIHFATANGLHRIAFDCSHLNEATQWDIIDAATGRRITFTMASFWSNKIWKWIDRRQEFWRDTV